MSALIALDWGTSHLRAGLLDAAGQVLELRRSAHGIRALPEGGFDAALAEITRGWPQCPRLACGMVGARDGWREMPYLDIPVAAGEVAVALGEISAADGHPLLLVPGLRQRQRPDVMRGEETQVLGALALEPTLAARVTLVLPGTHCKWVMLHDGRVVDFRTAMTGELFAWLSAHSTLAGGRLPQTGVGARFVDGVREARESGSAGGLSRLFRARALRLDGRLAEEEVSGWLSGLLIGEEIRSVLAEPGFTLGMPVRLIGDPVLCGYYRRALAEFSVVSEGEAVETVMSGLWWIARESGMV